MWTTGNCLLSDRTNEAAKKLFEAQRLHHLALGREVGNTVLGRYAAEMLP